jgi:hypothetical protein
MAATNIALPHNRQLFLRHLARDDNHNQIATINCDLFGKNDHDHLGKLVA